MDGRPQAAGTVHGDILNDLAHTTWPPDLAEQFRLDFS